MKKSLEEKRYYMKYAKESVANTTDELRGLLYNVRAAQYQPKAFTRYRIQSAIKMLEALETEIKEWLEKEKK